MKTSISLKQLRTDPRSYIRMLNNGYEVDITEHRKVIATSPAPSQPDKNQQSKPEPGNIAAILRVISTLPPIQVLDPQLDTIAAAEQAKHDYFRKKYGQNK